MIDLDAVTKQYRTRFLGKDSAIRALDGVTLRVEPGEALGIVGLNGAGKSTLLRLLLGYLRPTSGKVAIDGLAPRNYVERFGIAYVPERVAIPRHWSVRGAMRAYAMLGNLGADAWDRVEEAMDRLGLRTLANRKVGTLSKGNVQRLGIAQALLGDRRLLVLDEPTDGLDPVWIAGLREIVAEWRAADPQRIVLLASHNLPEVERLTDRVLLLHNGRLEGELPRSGRGSLEREFLDRLAHLEGARA